MADTAPMPTTDSELGPSDAALPAPFRALSNASPGKAPEVPDLAWLDCPAQWREFSQSVGGEAAAGPVWESSIVVQGMHCAACGLDIERALGALPGVLSASVSAASGRARVVWSEQAVLPSRWLGSIRALGYGVQPAMDADSRLRARQESRKMLWRWLVAGLCMMQVMMYAYPAYVARSGDLSAESEHLLRWASWVLSLPVVLFSCGPFFKSAWADMRNRRIGMDMPVSLGIVITFIASTLGTFEPAGMFGREVYFDSLTMFVFFLLSGRWLELRLRERTAGSLQALLNRFEDSVLRQSVGGAFERVAARNLQVGDVVRVCRGEAFVADGLITQGTTLVDEALLTGESHPVQRTAGDSVIAASVNLGSSVDVRLTQVGAQTRLGQISRLMQSAAASKPPIAALADRLAKPFLQGVLLVALAAGSAWWFVNPQHAVMVAVAILIVTCPCALSLATPAATLAAAGLLARRGVLVRDLKVLQVLGSVDTVVFDKTGTLTSTDMALGSVSVRQGAAQADVLQGVGALAQHSSHPVSRALHAALATDVPGSAAWVCQELTEEAVGQGIRGKLLRAGAAQPALELRLGSAAFCDAPALHGNGVTDKGPCLQVHVADAQGWLASLELIEQLRPQAVNVMADLRNAGIQIRILSGDAQPNVQRVAALLGIQGAQGGCSPADKLAALKALQAGGHTVAMVGDGLNDGPVLAGADASFAFGNASALTRSHSDVVVMGANLQAVQSTILLARRTMAVVRQNLLWALLYNAICVPLAVMGWLPAWAAGLGMATSSLVVVLNAARLSRAQMPRAASNGTASAALAAPQPAWKV